MTYAPSLLIGLGGTGAEVLLRVKKQLQDRGLADEGLHRFLFVDTDRDTFASGRDLPTVEAREKCLVGMDKTEDFLSHEDVFSALKSRFPEEHLDRSVISHLRKGRGSSQIRSLGAFAVSLGADRITDKLKAAYEDLIHAKTTAETMIGADGPEISHQMHVYLVGSLAGGTGSGGFLELSLLSKRVCPNDSTLFGMFALPDAFGDLVQNSTQEAHLQANTYAALKELQFCLDAGRDERQEIGSIEFNHDSAAITNLDLSPHDRLFDLCFLVDHQNSRGELSRIGEFYSLMARSLLNDVGFSLGASVASLESQIAVSNGVSKCPTTNLQRPFGTISTSVLSYPADRVANYCTYRTAESVVQDHLIGTCPSEETLRDRLSEFLNRHDLEDRGDSNQLLESLLQADSQGSLEPAPEDGGLVTRSWFDLQYDFGEDHSGEEFARRIRDEWNRFSNQLRPRIENVADQNRKHRIGSTDSSPDNPLRSGLEELVLSTAAEYGARAAYQILEMLEEAAVQMRTEFHEESEEWNERKEWLSKQFTDKADELVEVGTIKALFTSEDTDLKKHLIELYNERVEGALREAARSKARRVVDSLIAEVRDISSQWGDLLTKLTRLRKTLRRKANDLEMHGRNIGFAVEQEITRAGHEQRYYEENDMGSEDAFDKVLDAYDDASDRRVELFRDALRQGEKEFANDALISPLYDHIKDPIFDTNVVEFAESHPEEVLENGEENALRKKLEIQDDLCQPFWPAEPQKDEAFPEYRGLRAPEEGFGVDATPVYSPAIEEWKEVHGYNSIPSTNKREIVLSKITMGARAFYLRSWEDWKLMYDRVDSEHEYTMHVHPALRDIPDLFPDLSPDAESDDHLYEPYSFRFEEGDLVQLKEGDDLQQTHTELKRMVQEGGIQVDWCPPMDVLKDLSDVVFRVVRPHAFHGGVPLHILQFKKDGQTQKLRLCEVLLEEAEADR